jgi:hypothetical protein
VTLFCVWNEVEARVQLSQSSVSLRNISVHGSLSEKKKFQTLIKNIHFNSGALKVVFHDLSFHKLSPPVQN